MGSIIPPKKGFDFPPVNPPQTTPPPPIPVGGGYQGGIRGGGQMSPYSPGDYRRRPYGIAAAAPRGTMFGGGAPTVGAAMMAAPAQAMQTTTTAPPPATAPPTAPPAAPGNFERVYGPKDQTGTNSPDYQRNYSAFAAPLYWGAQYDPNNPFGYLGADPRANYWGFINRMLGAGGAAGAFDPLGSQGLVDLLTSQAQRQQSGMTRSALDQARTSGIDPSAYGYAALQAQINGSGNQAGAALQAQMQSALQNQQFLQQLAANTQNLSNSQALGQQGFYNQSALNNQNRPGWQDYLGSVLGTGIGALAGNPGFGAGLAKRIF